MTNSTSFEFLPLTLSIETKGGLATPLVRRGTPLPTKRQLQLSTAVDNQEGIGVKVYLGESPIVANNVFVEKWELNSLPKAPRGELRIKVTIEVNNKCSIMVNISATEKSGKVIETENEEASLNLTEEKVQEILSKAKESRQKDETLAQLIEERNNASNMVYRAEMYLQNQQKYGYGIPKDKKIEEALASLGLSLQDNDLNAIKDKSKKLEQLLPKALAYPFGDFFNQNIFEDFFSPSTRQKQESRSTEKTSKGNTRGPAPNKSETSQSEEIVESKNGLFSAGQHFDAKRMVRDLFAQAFKEIIVIDAYVGEDVLNLLTVKCAGVTVKLLTTKVSPVFLTLAHDFNRQYKGLEVRSSEAFHDRFVIIDDKDFYHFGASLEHLGNKTFMFSKIEEPTITTALHKQWQEIWVQATHKL